MPKDKPELVGPYDEDVCHFCGASYSKSKRIEDVAGYERAEDKSPRGPFFNSCESCARKPYPQPDHLKRKT